MELFIEDFIILFVFLTIILTIKIFKERLPKVLNIKDKSMVPVFSIKRDRLIPLISGLGFYVWLVEFFIANEKVLLRLFSVSLIQLSLFFLLIISNLGYSKLGKFVGILMSILFLASIIYYT